MKRCLTGILLVVMTVGLLGCSQNTAAEIVRTAEETPAELA